MSSSAAKKDDPQAQPEAIDLSSPPNPDREQGLSQNFQDPSLEELIPNLVAEGESSPQSVVHEAVEAVQELVVEAQAEQGAESIDLSEDFGNLNLQPEQEGSSDSPAFDPDPVPAGLVADAPSDGIEEEPAQLLDLGAVANLKGDAAPDGHWAMAKQIFELVVCEKTFDEMVELALAAIMGGLEAEAGAVLEMDHDQQNYFFRASVGGGDATKVKAFRVPFHKGIVGLVGESQRATLLRDLEEDQKQMRAISMSSGFEAKTCMAAPVHVGGQLYGVIELFNKRGGGFFTESDLKALEDSTRMLAKVLEVRFLMAELVKRR